MRKLKHSKFKNAGILFELLTRQVTADILAGRDESFTKNLMFKYFHESKELGKEVQLYNFFAGNNAKDENSAERIINVVLQARAKLNERELQKQKYELIKEIKEKYPIEEFLKSKVKNYRLYASVYKLFENYINSENKFEVSEVIQAREFILENLTNKKEQNQKDDLNVYNEQPHDVRLMAYKFLIENFNKKYSNLLPDQKNLLKNYITNISNTNKFTAYVSEEYKRVVSELKQYVDKIDSSVTKIKLNETISQLNSKNIVNIVKENQLTALMMSYDLLEELKKINSNEKRSI